MRCSEYQRYQLLRAIHNKNNWGATNIWVVPNIKDINFWEQFTTEMSERSLYWLLFRISKISTFESNSQQYFTSVTNAVGCSEYQRYQLLRAIHNSCSEVKSNNPVVPNIKDINFWEQFTTPRMTAIPRAALFRISKISTFESNSQPCTLPTLKNKGCSEYQRYQLLRAIHN